MALFEEKKGEKAKKSRFFFVRKKIICIFALEL